MTDFSSNGRKRPQTSCIQTSHAACRNFYGNVLLTMKQEVSESYKSICSHEIFRLASQTKGSLDSSDKVQLLI